jgi:hypothetical protein
MSPPMAPSSGSPRRPLEEKGLGMPCINLVAGPTLFWCLFEGENNLTAEFFACGVFITAFAFAKPQVRQGKASDRCTHLRDLLGNRQVFKVCLLHTQTIPSCLLCSCNSATPPRIARRSAYSLHYLTEHFPTCLRYNPFHEDASLSLGF